MKKIEFKTGKCEFILLDMPFFTDNVTDPYPTVIDWNLTTLNVQDIDTGNYVFAIDFNKPVDFIGYIKEMTEIQFAEVVDISFDTPRMYRDYACNIPGLNARQSFETLINSLGCYLFTNPIRQAERKGALLDDGGFERMCKYEDEITFFNPILLKKQ